MQKKNIYALLLPYKSMYTALHQRTADIDLLIIRKFAEGKGAVQIAMEVPCAEATVYRAVSRVRRFLEEHKDPCCEAGAKSAEYKEKS